MAGSQRKDRRGGRGTAGRPAAEIGQVCRFLAYALRAASSANTQPVRIARLRAASRWIHAAEMKLEQALISAERAQAIANRTREDS